MEVVYATPSGAVSRRVVLAGAATVREAIDGSGIVRELGEIDLARNCVGIHGRLATLETRVSPGDRVEIYRPLAADPKDARRMRAVRRRDRGTR